MEVLLVLVLELEVVLLFKEVLAAVDGIYIQMTWLFNIHVCFQG